MQQITLESFFTDENIKKFLNSKKLFARNIMYHNENGEKLDIKKFEEYFTPKEPNNGSVPEIYESIIVTSTQRINSSVVGFELLLGSINFEDLNAFNEEDKDQSFDFYFQGRIFFDAKNGILRYFDPSGIISENPYQIIWEIKKN